MSSTDPAASAAADPDAVADAVADDDTTDDESPVVTVDGPAAKRPRYAPADGDLIRDASAVLASLRRMRNTNDGVSFWNADRTIKFMLRNDSEAYDLDPEPPDTDIHTDLCIVVDEDDATIAKVLELEHDGYFDEPTMFVLESYSVSPTDPADEELLDLIKKLNEAHKFRICPCGSYVIKDQAPQCLFCELTAEPGASKSEFCAICQDDGIAAHMTTQPCCTQPLHKACLSAWKDRQTGSSMTCPLCRAQQQ
jgi:hypothetical protein